MYTYLHSCGYLYKTSIKINVETKAITEMKSDTERKMKLESLYKIVSERELTHGLIAQSVRAHLKVFLLKKYIDPILEDPADVLPAQKRSFLNSFMTEVLQISI